MKTKIYKNKQTNSLFQEKPKYSNQANLQDILQKKVSQFIRFEAGDGADWHVHKDHVKYDSVKNSRVDFKGRSAANIINKLDEIIQRHNLDNTITNNANYVACIQYINNNFQ